MRSLLHIKLYDKALLVGNRHLNFFSSSKEVWTVSDNCFQDYKDPQTCCLKNKKLPIYNLMSQYINKHKKCFVMSEPFLAHIILNNLDPVFVRLDGQVSRDFWRQIFCWNRIRSFLRFFSCNYVSRRYSLAPTKILKWTMKIIYCFKVAISQLEFNRYLPSTPFS